MPILTLHGCSPEPLGNYLKALGVFRLVAEQADSAARAWWENGCFRLSTSRFESIEKLADWIHAKCRFTAFVAPWLANTGWGRKGKRPEGADALSKLLADKNPRTRRFRKAARLIIKLANSKCTRRPTAPCADAKVEDWVKKFHKDDIGSIITQLRNHAPTEMLSWLDSVGAPKRKDGYLSKDWFPLFAKGGAEGSGNYIVRQQEYLADSLVDNPERGKSRLECSLTGKTIPDLLVADSLSGLFYPGFRGDPNIGQSFHARTRADPWDFILLMEGLLFFRSAVTRRLGVEQDFRPAFPFYCDSSLGGVPSIGIREIPESDKSISSGEVWCPLWDSPLSFYVLRSLLSEGRFQVAGRSVKKAAQFALAAARFGCDRGIKAFLRYGLFRRSGSYGKKDQTAPLAVPLGVFPVSRLPRLALLEELLDFDETFGWRSGVHPGSGHNHPVRVVAAWTDYDSAKFKAVTAAQAGNADEGLVAPLLALGRLVREFAVTKGKVRSGRGENASAPPKPNAPLPPPLNTAWSNLALEQLPVEFQIAKSVASILPWGESAREARQPAVGSLLTNLIPVARHGGRWVWDEQTRSAVWSDGAPLFANFAAVLRRRLADGQSGNGEGLPLASFHTASFQDLLQLWRGVLDEARLSELVHALALVDFGSSRDQARFEARQVEQDSTPTLAQSGVWFGVTDEPRINLQSSVRASPGEQEAAFALPRAYALLKLCFLGGRLPAPPRERTNRSRTGEEPYPNPPLALLNLLLAGRGAEALQAASWMLRAKGYPPIVPDSVFANGEWSLSSQDSQQMAGLLLIPVRQPGVLAALCIKPQNT